MIQKAGIVLTAITIGIIAGGVYIAFLWHFILKSLEWYAAGDFLKAGSGVLAILLLIGFGLILIGEFTGEKELHRSDYP
mgnify:CR=1 FL=1